MGMLMQFGALGKRKMCQYVQNQVTLVRLSETTYISWIFLWFMSWNAFNGFGMQDLSSYFGYYGKERNGRVLHGIEKIVHVFNEICQNSFCCIVSLDFYYAFFIVEQESKMYIAEQLQMCGF